MAEEYEHSLSELAEALWNTLCEPVLLDTDKRCLEMVKTWMRICLNTKSRCPQFMVVRTISREQGYHDSSLTYCLLGLLLQKMLEAKPKLEQRRAEYDRDHFHRYLFKTSGIVLVKCLTELSESMLGNPEELPQKWVDLRGENTYISWESIQYNICLRSQALLLNHVIQESWSDRELNVLCHDLEVGTDFGKSRLADESRDNVYQLHKRIRSKVIQTMEAHAISEAAGRLFIGKYLQRLCQKCPALRSYKVLEESDSRGDSNVND